MPTIGSFHGKFWRARANVPEAPVSSVGAVYPKYQNVVHRAVSLSMVGFWVPLDAIRPWIDHLAWYWRLAKRLWRWPASSNWARLETWIARLEQFDTEQLAMIERVVALCAQPASRDSLNIWIARLETCSADHANLLDRLVALPAVPWLRLLEVCDDEQRAVFLRVAEILGSPHWAETQERVRACATSPKFHQPEQWLEYSRALKANVGQAQNVFRHIKVVHELKAKHPEMSNPDAHLLAELAYQGFAYADRRERQIVTHPSQVVEHEKVHIAH